MAYNMSYSTLPTMTSNSIGGIITSLTHQDLLGTYVSASSATNSIFSVSLSPGAYVFTSSVFASSTNDFVLQSSLIMNGTTYLVDSTTHVAAISLSGNPSDGGTVSSCNAFQVATTSTIVFQINFPVILPSSVGTSVYGGWSLMRIG